MPLSIDSARCTGHGRCYSLAEALFEPDDAGKGEVVIADVPPALRDHARRAVANCPEGAIALT